MPVFGIVSLCAFFLDVLVSGGAVKAHTPALSFDSLTSFGLFFLVLQLCFWKRNL